MSDYKLGSVTLDRPASTRWDYIVRTIHARNDEVFEDQLRELGRENWELASVHVPMPLEYQCIFRRPMDH